MVRTFSVVVSAAAWSLLLGACASSESQQDPVDASFDVPGDADLLDGPEDAATSDAHAAPEWSSHPSQIHAGGGTNAVAVDPFDSNHLVSAGDVSGIHLSANRGVDFENTSRGLVGEEELNGVAVAHSSIERDRVFYLAGNKGEVDTAGLFASHDGGRTWTLQSRQPRASASDNPRSGELAGEPRVVGRLLALDEQAEPRRRILYVGTYGDGVLRSDDDGRTYEALALPESHATAYVTGLWLSPTRDGSRFLFVAVKNEGVWRVQIDSTTGAIASAEHLTSAPVGVEEISGNAHMLVVAAGMDGAFVSTDLGSTFERAPLESAFVDDVIHGRWTAVAVADSSALATTAIWLGCYSLSDARCTESLLRSVDGGTTWQSGVPNALPSPLYFAESEDIYWHTDGYAQNEVSQNESLLGGRNFKAYQLVIADDDPSTLYVAANGVAWRTRDGGESWAPIGRGVGATVAVAVAHAPADDDSKIFGMYDWSVVLAPSITGPARWHRPVQDTRTGRAFAYESLDVGGRWVMALSLQDNGAAGATLGGSVWTATSAVFDHPPAAETWVDEGLDVATDGRVVGVAVGRNHAGERVLLASVANGTPADRAASAHLCNAQTSAVSLGCAGVFRKVGDGAWEQVLGGIDVLAATSAKAPLVWIEGSPIVFFLDSRRGLFVSADWGENFSQVRDYRDGHGGVWGHLAVTRASPLIVYVSRRSEIAERIIVSGDTFSPLTTINTVSLPDGAPVGPLGVDAEGALYVASIATPEHEASLWRSPDGLLPFTQISDEAYAGQAIVPTDLSVAPNGDASVACWGTGFVEVRHAPAP